MIVYFDTSALIKRYFTESGSPAVVELWARATLIAASQITYAEMNATFARKAREYSQHSMASDRARTLSARTGKASSASQSTPR